MFSTLKCLIFAKDKATELLIKKMIDKNNNHVLAVSNEEELKRAVSSEDVDVILSDLPIAVPEKVVPVYVIINRMSKNLEKLSKLAGEIGA